MPAAITAKQFGRQLPPSQQWGGCKFIFEPDALTYDWLVVYHDIYAGHGNGGAERLQCPPENTILVTTEPSTITVYGTDYLRQYATVITSQEPWVINHPNPFFTQPGLFWFYGLPFGDGHVRSYEELTLAPMPTKNRVLSTVCSARQGKLTAHSRRVAFTAKLKAAITDLDVFGHGVRPMLDKAESLDPYFYHIAVENHSYRHHLTEKLPDAFLGYTLPFYHGCPNATDYFPPESFIPIDINNFAKTLDIIQSTIANNEYQDRVPYIREARRRVLEEHNLFALLDRYVSSHPKSRVNLEPHQDKRAVINNRQSLRRRNPVVATRSLVEKITVKSRHYLGAPTDL